MWEAKDFKDDKDEKGSNSREEEKVCLLFVSRIIFGPHREVIFKY